MSVNPAFSRELLKRVLDDVRAYRKSTGDRFAFKLTDAWIYRAGTDHWEFHFGEFYWHGSADNGFEARAKGWSSWLSRAGWKMTWDEDAGRIDDDGHSSGSLGVCNQHLSGPGQSPGQRGASFRERRAAGCEAAALQQYLEQGREADLRSCRRRQVVCSESDDY